MRFSYGRWCLTLPETHLPNAFDLFAFVPYWFLKAAGSACCSARHCLAALTVALTCFASAALAFEEMRQPAA